MLILGFAVGVALLACAVGLVVLVRSPRHPAHLTFALGMSTLAAETVVAALALPEVSEWGTLEWMRLRLIVAALIPAPWVAFSRLYSRGDHALARQRWQVAWWALAILPVVGALVFQHDLVVATTPPDAPTPLARLGLAGLAVELFLLLGSVAVLTQVERTFRESVGVMRWRIKYLSLGVVALFGFRLYATSQALLFATPGEVIGRTGTVALLVACALMSVGLTRNRIFNVDVYPSQALVYRSVAVLLTGSYLVIVGVLSQVIGSLGNPGGLPLRAFLILVALAGLAALLLSERTRLQLRQFISRHLRRPTHDYREVWRTFTARTSSLVEPAAYCRAVTHWVSDTFQTLSASVWLLEESGDRLRLGGSTVLSDEAAREIELSGDELRTALAALTRLHGPVVIDATGHPWAEALARLHPGVFPHGGRRVGLPLDAGGRFLGLITLGDRVGGQPFTTEDLDLLKCVSDQVAAGLLGLRLSGQLVRAKEMEAFQTMSAFFVHDLKNTASTLSLTLQNLHEHFGNPDFREDALRAVQKSVQHLNGVIARLARLRQGLRVELASTQLGSVVATALDTLGPLPSIRLIREVTDLPPVMLDEEEFTKVIVNLVLNARDATGPGGEIRVRTAPEGVWAVVTVADNGVGMTPEFVRDSLFRPFQTTKNTGLGIGMFHSKMIVEAHRGRIEVESSFGEGTSFRVLIPFANGA